MKITSKYLTFVQFVLSNEWQTENASFALIKFMIMQAGLSFGIYFLGSQQKRKPALNVTFS